MAMTPQERDEKRKKKEAKAGVEELRMKTRAGTRQAWPRSCNGPKSRKTARP